MRALWSDRQTCSHNVSQKVKRIRRLSDFWEGILEGILVGLFLTHKIKAQKIRGKFRSIFRGKIRAAKKKKKNYFVPTSFCRRATPNILP